MTNHASVFALAGKFDAYPVAEEAISRATFSQAERMVLDIAWRETHRLHVFDNAPFRRVRQLLGLKEPLPFADPKLEALRQYAIRLARARQPIESDGMIDAGYSAQQVATLHIAFMGHKAAKAMRFAGQRA